MSHVFFDLDKTLIRKESQGLLIQVLYKRDIISYGTLWKLRFLFLKYKLHLIGEEKMISLFTEVSKLFKGVDVEYVKKVVRAFVFAEFAAIVNLRAVNRYVFTCIYGDAHAPLSRCVQMFFTVADDFTAGDVYVRCVQHHQNIKPLAPCWLGNQLGC